MNTFGQANFTGEVSAALAAVNPNDLTRLGEMQALLSGKANKSHTHSIDDILDEPVKFLVRVDEVIADSTDVFWIDTGNVMYGNLRLDPAGKIIRNGPGLAVDFTGIARTGDAINSSQISDYAAAFAAQLGTDVRDTNDLVWQRGAVLSGFARLRPGGGIVSNPLGLMVDNTIYMAQGDTITFDQISDSNIALPIALGGIIADTQDIVWSRGVQLSGTARLQPGGGLLHTPTGLAIDPTVVNTGESTFTVSQITDFAAGVLIQLGNDIADTNTIYWTGRPNGILSGNARLNPTGALLADSSGIRVNLGTGATQAAYGSHGHSQLHNPVTLGASQSLVLTLAGQVLAGEVNLAPSSGLKISASGLGVDFGFGPAQAMTGDKFAILSGLASQTWTVQSTASLVLYFDGHILSGTTRLDPSPPSGFGLMQIGAGGISVLLGTTSNTAAAGNHSHGLATEAVNGFMSAVDKIALDTLVAATPGTGLSVVETNTFKPYYNSGTGVFSGTAKIEPSPSVNFGLLSSTINGLCVQLGTNANQAAAGNHNHNSLYVSLAGSTMTGLLTLSGPPTLASHAATKNYVDTTALLLAGGTMAGNIVLAGDPTASLHPATKQYVDTADGLRLLLAGGTMTGPIILAADPTSNLHPATKQYVDAGLALKLNLNGGTMTGLLTLSGPPTASAHASTKGYVDSAISGLTTSYLGLGGGTLTGPLILAGAPATGLGAATKTYVDGIVNAKLAAQSTIANAANASADPPTAADFNALVATVNSILTLLHNLGLP